MARPVDPFDISREHVRQAHVVEAVSHRDWAIMLEFLTAGDDVAILPAADSPPQHTLEIVKVAFVNVHLVRLVDHRVYSLAERHGLTPTSRGFLAPATDAHRNALNASPTSGGDAIDRIERGRFGA